ncbi:MAG: hypothetical protein JRI23_36700 [Deltaproteobacteria bacterium]|jgi:hypothetical protein|nr:hypothetical protein [Deltaproteobacteria bacterium]MBW2537910.1 hypothetical protein [Deltaproteobacteria bacterium]
MDALFPPQTFAEITPRFEFICTETHARKGGTALKVEVVRTGGEPGKLPPAMQEWAKLGWYEMAVFAVARRRCCAEPPPLATPLGIDLCPLDQALEELGKAAVGGDDEAVTQAIDGYTKVAQCLVRAGASKAFGQAVAPTKAATETFQTILRRASEATK